MDENETKECKKCRRILPIVNFSPTGKEKRYTYCKKCKNEYERIRTSNKKRPLSAANAPPSGTAHGLEMNHTKECKTCHRILSIVKFPRHGNNRRPSCKKCFYHDMNIRRRAKTKSSISLNASQRETAPDPPLDRKSHRIYWSPLTLEELLRKQTWYDEPRMYNKRKIWVEPLTCIIERLVNTSSVDIVYNYKRFQIKRSKVSSLSGYIKVNTFLKLKKIHDELEITYNELIWRLIENDKHTK